MDNIERNLEIKRRNEIIEAFLDGKAIQCKDRDSDEWTDIARFPKFSKELEYRIKPDEADEPKKLMTYRQLSELITKGYGQWLYNYDNAVMGKNTLFIDKEVNENILIRPWGLDKLVRPTMDVYEEFMKRKAEADTIKDYSGASKVEPKVDEVFKYKGMTLKCVEGDSCEDCVFNKTDCNPTECRRSRRHDGKMVFFVDVSKMENTTASEDSSATDVGVHRRTPQEIADFFNCYVAYDSSIGSFSTYEKPLVFSDEIGWIGGGYNPSLVSDRFVATTDSCKEKHIIYRPHQEPLVVEEKDRQGCASLAMGAIGSLAEKEEDDD